MEINPKSSPKVLSLGDSLTVHFCLNSCQFVSVVLLVCLFVCLWLSGWWKLAVWSNGWLIVYDAHTRTHAHTRMHARARTLTHTHTHAHPNTPHPTHTHARKLARTHARMLGLKNCRIIPCLFIYGKTKEKRKRPFAQKLHTQKAATAEGFLDTGTNISRRTNIG